VYKTNNKRESVQNKQQNGKRTKQTTKQKVYKINNKRESVQNKQQNGKRTKQT
jgi:hypothetical protein